MVALTAAGVVLVTRRGGGVSWQGGLPFGEADDAVDFLHGSRELRQRSPFSPAFRNKFKLVHFRNFKIKIRNIFNQSIGKALSTQVFPLFKT